MFEKIKYWFSLSICTPADLPCYEKKNFLSSAFSSVTLVFGSFITYISFMMFRDSLRKEEKIKVTFEITPETFRMAHHLAMEFYMSEDELISFLVYKQFFLYNEFLENEEKKASQIKANEN